MPIDTAIVSDTPIRGNSSPQRRFSIFVTVGTNNVLLMEHKPNRSMPRLLGWVTNEDWGNKLALALEGYDGKKPHLLKPAWVRDRSVYLFDDYLLIVCGFQTQAQRIASAYNHFTVDMLAVLS